MNKTLVMFTTVILALTGCGEEKGNTKEPTLVINNNINTVPPQEDIVIEHPQQSTKTKAATDTIEHQAVKKTTSQLVTPVVTATTSTSLSVPQLVVTTPQSQTQKSTNTPNINENINKNAGNNSTTSEEAIAHNKLHQASSIDKKPNNKPKKTSNIDTQADNEKKQDHKIDVQAEDILPVEEVSTPHDPLWHPEPGPAEQLPESIKIAHLKIPEALTPVISVRDNEFPTKNSILDATLNQHYEEAVTALWQQDGKADPLATCDLAGAKNTCHLELNKLELNSKPIRLCLDNGNCDTIVLPSVKFVGQLNYKGQVTAEPQGFSKDLNISWYHSDIDDTNRAIDNSNLLTNADDSLHIKLQSTEHNANFYVHEYLFFCLTDNANHWPRQCFNVGAQASDAYNMVDLLSTLHEDNSLVGGALVDNSDNPAIRRIGPVPFLKTSRNETIYRPLTQAELASIKIKLHSKYVSFRKSSIYPQLTYINERYPAEKYFSYWQFGDAKSLCSGQNMAGLVPSINTLKELKLSELNDSGWPKGKYWSNTNYSIHNEQWVLDSNDGNKLSEDNKYSTAFIACQTY